MSQARQQSCKQAQSVLPVSCYHRLQTKNNVKDAGCIDATNCIATNTKAKRVIHTM